MSEKAALRAIVEKQGVPVELSPDCERWLEVIGVRSAIRCREDFLDEGGRRTRRAGSLTIHEEIWAETHPGEDLPKKGWFVRIPSYKQTDEDGELIEFRVEETSDYGGKNCGCKIEFKEAC